MSVTLSESKIMREFIKAYMSNISLCQVITLPIKISKADIIICHLQITIKDNERGDFFPL